MTIKNFEFKYSQTTTIYFWDTSKISKVHFGDELSFLSDDW